METNRVGKILGISILVFGLLAASHKGEFWPFSIYPMFSKAGNPWNRAMVQQYAPDDSLNWTMLPIEELTGKQLALKSVSVDPIDFANFINKTKVWDEKRLEALRSQFYRVDFANTKLVCYRVHGEINQDGDVVVEADPYVILSANQTLVNPKLQTEQNS